MRKIIENKKILRATLSIVVLLSMFIAPALISEGLHLILGDQNSSLITFLYMPIYIGFIVLIYFKEMKEEFKIFKNNIKYNLENGVKYWLLGLVFMIATNIVITLIIFKGQIAANQVLVEEQMLKAPVFTLLSAIIFAPIIEEIIFRKSIDKIFKSEITYIVTSGVLFGFVHTVADLSSMSYLLYMIPYACLGVGFAIMNNKTKTIFTSITFHMIHNLLVCGIFLLSR